MKTKSLIDVHVHMAAFPDGKNKCLMSPEFQKSLTVRYIRSKMGLISDDSLIMNQQYVTRLVEDLDQSTQVKTAVLLAFDGVYNESGELDTERTTCLVSNDYVAEVVSKYPDRFILGASVNPQRRDALDELNRVIDMGTRLIKVLPNSQDFDLSNPHYKNFYRVLADKKIPLLSHIGKEHTFTVYNQKLGFPEGLRLPLEMGVSVIAAHGCGSNDLFHEKYYRVFLSLMKTYPHFYVDFSALTLPLSLGMMFNLRRHPEYFDRYLFGTDYPLSAFATFVLGRIPFGKQISLWKEKNIFDKQVGVLKAVGLKPNTVVTKNLLKMTED